MLTLQRWTQVAWLLASTLLVYSNFVHSGPDQFPIAALLWVLLAAGTVLLFLGRASGVIVSSVAACLVLVAAGPWVVGELMRGIPQGSPAVGNPVSIFVGLLYFLLSLAPAGLMLLLNWFNRR